MLTKQRSSAPLLLIVERTSGARITLQDVQTSSSMVLRSQRGYGARNKKYLMKRWLRLRDSNSTQWGDGLLARALTWLITTMLWMARVAVRVVRSKVGREGAEEKLGFREDDEYPWFDTPYIISLAHETIDTVPGGRTLSQWTAILSIGVDQHSSIQLLFIIIAGLIFSRPWLSKQDSLAT